MCFPEIFQSIQSCQASLMFGTATVVLCLVLLLITGWHGKGTGNMVAVQGRVQLDPLILSQAQTCYES